MYVLIPHIVRLLKGIFNLRPTRAWYTETWDVNIGLSYLKPIPVGKESYLKDLTIKLTMLLTLKLAARQNVTPNYNKGYD